MKHVQRREGAVAVADHQKSTRVPPLNSLWISDDPKTASVCCTTTAYGKEKPYGRFVVRSHEEQIRHLRLPLCPF